MFSVVEILKTNPHSHSYLKGFSSSGQGQSSGNLLFFGSILTQQQPLIVGFTQFLFLRFFLLAAFTSPVPKKKRMARKPAPNAMDPILGR